MSFRDPSDALLALCAISDHGLVRTQDANAAGFGPSELRALVKS